LTALRNKRSSSSFADVKSSGASPAESVKAAPCDTIVANAKPPDETTTVPRIYLGGVQRKACALAGSIADGFVTHPTNSNPRYLETVCRPGLAEGAAAAGRDLTTDNFELVVGTQVITGVTEAALQAERERQRRLLAFLYSTPAYRPTLELYGWSELGPQLRALIHRDEWDGLGQLLPDEVIDTLVPTGTFEDLPKLLHDRFAGLAQGIVVSPPPDAGADGAFAEVIAALQAS